MTIEDIEEQTDEQIGKARVAILWITRELTNLENICWYLRYPNRRKVYGGQLPIEAQYKKCANNIEFQACVLNEVIEKLMDLHGKLMDEIDDPSCPNCGEKMEVRTGVDSEGFHHCTGE